MTSVKEFRVEREPTAGELGRGAFVFTDDYSVFDWGAMPDRIPEKGASLCTMGAFNFELLEFNHVPTHYLGVTDRNTTAHHAPSSGESESDAIREGDIEELGQVSSAPREMVIELTQVPDLPFADGNYDYDAYHGAAGDNYLIPLEIVFRNTVPIGSSLRKRGAPADYGLDVSEWPEEAVELPEPVVEFSTKYEEQDRYLSREEADRVAGVADVDRLEELALAVNHVVTDRGERSGFVHEDGKIECLYHDGTIKVADVVGTFDENRFSYGGQEISKEVVRQHYKRADPAWVDAVAAAKSEAKERGVADWRELCEREPSPLPGEVVAVIADMYGAGTNAYTDHGWFDAPGVDEAVDAIRNL